MLSKDKKEQIDNLLKQYVPGYLPGAAVFIGKEGRIIHNQGYGLADIEEEKLVTTDTLFMIASISKQFTTMAIMILKEQGLLEFDETIERFFPDFPEYKTQVTIRHLMTHTSGIKEYFTEEFILKTDKVEDKLTQAELLEDIKGFGGLDFTPGSKFSYCNSAYVMLGVIVEKVSGNSFAEFIDEQIFKPLGMNNSIVGTHGKHLPQAAFGYERSENAKGYQRTPYNRTVVGWADGNILTTAADLFKWHNALYTDKLVSQQLIKTAFTPYQLTDGTSANYGFGWFINNRRGLKEYWHTGGTVGFTSRFSRFIDDDIAIIIFTNLDPGSANNFNNIFGEIVEIVLADRLKPVIYQELPAGILREISGKYQLEDQSCELVYQQKENQLILKSELKLIKDNVELKPISEKLFRLDLAADYYLRLIKTGDVIKAIELDFNGRKMRFKAL